MNQAEEDRATERKAAYEALAKRAGDFEVFRMQSDARPGWSALLTPEQIAKFGIGDNFEPISHEQYRAGLAEMRKDDAKPDESDLDHLKNHAAKRAHQFALEATVTYDCSDGFITVEIISVAGGGQPRSKKRAIKFLNRMQAEAFIDGAIWAWPSL